MSNDRLIVRNILEQKHSETAADLSESKFFEIFCASEILKDFDLSYDEINSGIIGAGSDGGIDSIYIFHNGDLIQEDTDLENLTRKRKSQIDIHIVQSKKVNGFGEEAINKFVSSTEELFDFSRSLDSLSSVYSDYLLSAAQRFRDIYNRVASNFPDISFTFYYATLGSEVHPNVKRKTDRLRQTVVGHFDNAVFNFNFIGARELLQLARRQPSSTFELEFTENPISTETGSYVCLVSLKNYFSFFIDKNDVIIKRIFDANVRDYQGNVKVNRAIQDTLQNPGTEDFWFLNNGVTIVCPKATARGKKIIIDAPQIVNGLQTSYEIYSYFRNLKYEVDDSRKILIRVIVEEDPTARDNIVRATNSQTAIPQTSLRAADKIQRDIEDYLYQNDFYYERRKNFYKNTGKPISRIISISYLAQSVISILLQQPDYARARPSTLIDRDDDYTRIFNEKYPVSVYLKCIQLMKRVEECLKAYSDEYSLVRKEINNIKFHILMSVAMRLISKSSNIKVQDIEAIDLVQANNDFIREELDRVLQTYRELGGTDQISKGPVLVRELVDTFQIPIQVMETDNNSPS
ncbi:MAG: AIPR family protein [Leptolyngbyaceae bacterium]|nr:AIPR family protein [Leptolyngbyaceae bacterium]